MKGIKNETLKLVVSTFIGFSTSYYYYKKSHKDSITDYKFNSEKLDLLQNKIEAINLKVGTFNDNIYRENILKNEKIKNLIKDTD